MHLLSLAVQSPGTTFHIFVFVFMEEEARKAKGPSSLETVTQPSVWHPVLGEGGSFGMTFLFMLIELRKLYHLSCPVLLDAKTRTPRLLRRVALKIGLN